MKSFAAQGGLFCILENFILLIEKEKELTFVYKCYLKLSSQFPTKIIYAVHSKLLEINDFQIKPFDGVSNP